MEKRCTNCGRFPFCSYQKACQYSNCPADIGNLEILSHDYWIKRNIEIEVKENQ